MSVTFWCPSSPRKMVPCSFCQDEWADFPEGNGRGGKCDRFCTGETEESEAPEVQISGADIRGILTLLGFTAPMDDEPFGECTGATLRQRIMKARNVDRSALVVSPSDIPGGTAGTQVVQGDDGLPTIQRMGPRIISMGVSDERTLSRLDRLEALAIWAQGNGAEISWG